MKKHPFITVLLLLFTCILYALTQFFLIIAGLSMGQMSTELGLSGRTIFYLIPCLPSGVLLYLCSKRFIYLNVYFLAILFTAFATAHTAHLWNKGLPNANFFTTHSEWMYQNTLHVFLFDDRQSIGLMLNIVIIYIVIGLLGTFRKKFKVEFKS